MSGRVTAGMILAGKYRLVSLLGRGGMGSVWRAERMGWQSPVAIKLMNAMDVHDSPALARFQREARLAASLRSIHVVQVLDDGVDGTTGLPFIVMELLDGESLAERLARVKRLRPPVVAQIVTQIARALGRAHDAGLIHRDLKPDNILIVRNDDEEIVKVLDFGIAKWMAGPQNQAGGTLAGQMLGTPAYMSPEHFANSSHIDHRADLWSLGVIAFECLAGVRPFQGETLVSLALNVCSGKFPVASSLAEVPDGFDAWFERAVAQDAAHRYPSARVMAEELRGLCGHIPMLWEHEAAPPVQHATREKTELEPVLELTRRARSSHVPRSPDPSRVPRTPDPSRGSRPPDPWRGSRPPDPRFPITEVDSVLPMLRTPQPAKRHGWRWALAIAFFLGFIGTTVVATPTLLPFSMGPFSMEGVAARLREAAESLRGSPPLELAPAPASSAAPGPTNPSQRAVPQRTDIVSSLRRESDGGADAGRPATDASAF